MRPAVKLHDYEPKTDNLLEEVVRGLSEPKKWLPSKLFYDERGSALFERITELPEYYPTRTELAIMRDCADEIVAAMGDHGALIEYGSGSSEKTRILLARMDQPVAYIPIDISREHLLGSADAIQKAFPHIQVMPVRADYDQPFVLPTPKRLADKRVLYYPGSTIGNYHPDAAARFLQRAADHVGAAHGFLIGVDLKKDPAILNAAYNDSKGVTAAFNLNMLIHVNRVLGTNFDVDQFRHKAFYNSDAGRVEMHLVSGADQTVDLGEVQIRIAAGESVWTESSYKYTVTEFAALAARAGYRQSQVWTDKDELFSVQYFSHDG